MQHVVMFSAGAGSWAAARRVVELHGVDKVTLLFADTLSEDADAYRFLLEGAANVLGRNLHNLMAVPGPDDFPDFRDAAEWRLFLSGLRHQAAFALPELVWLCDGRDIWEVFFAERFLGNSRVDPCSKILKRRTVDRWLAANRDPVETVCHVGIDFTEKHRFDDGAGGGVRPRRAAQGWTYQAPLCDPPWTAKWDIIASLRAEGIEPPRLYAEGFSHNNCGGFCVKAGHDHFRQLLRMRPAHYAYHENKEQEIRALLGKDVSMLTDRSGGDGKKPLTLKSFREAIEANPQGYIDLGEYGGCGCFAS